MIQLAVAFKPERKYGVPARTTSEWNVYGWTYVGVRSAMTAPNSPHEENNRWVLLSIDPSS
jgi:hypothetical protein